MIGRGERIRTSDPLRPRQVRYQAALRPDCVERTATRGHKNLNTGKWRGLAGSGSRSRDRLRHELTSADKNVRATQTRLHYAPSGESC